MRKKLGAAVAVCLFFVPMLFSEAPSLGDSNQGKKQVSVPVSTDNASDILAFGEKLNLTSQQAISIRIIVSDARQELTEKSGIVTACKREYDKSLNQNTPDFAYIRSMLNKLKEAQANALEVSVNAYEKAYAQLTDTQKANLSFFRALRQQEIEKKAASSSQDSDQTTSTSTFTDNPSMIKHNLP